MSLVWRAITVAGGFEFQAGLNSLHDLHATNGFPARALASMSALSDTVLLTLWPSTSTIKSPPRPEHLRI
jgi:hypothetical protein